MDLLILEWIARIFEWIQPILEWIRPILEWMQPVLELVAYVVAAASALANLTPNERNSRLSKIFFGLIDALAGNFNVVSVDFWKWLKPSRVQ